MLPATLSRKAIMATFNRLEPVTWEKLFEREDQNGLCKHRIPIQPNDYSRKAYYVVDGIKDWLLREGYYTIDEFNANPRYSGQRLALSA